MRLRRHSAVVASLSLSTPPWKRPLQAQHLREPRVRSRVALGRARGAMAVAWRSLPIETRLEETAAGRKAQHLL